MAFKHPFQVPDLRVADNNRQQ